MENQNEKTITDMINRAKETVARAKKKSACTKPYPRPPRDYFETTMLHDFSKFGVRSAINQTSNQMLSFVKLKNIAHEKHTSLKKLEDLEPILLKDMKVNMIHYNKYLLCRIINEPYIQTALSLLIQDQEDDIEHLSIYDYGRSSSVDPNTLLPSGTVIIIKEPYLKFMINILDDFHIRVDSPSDIVIINDDSPYSIQKWKLNHSIDDFENLNYQGNKHFVQKDYEQALRLYTQALIVKKDSKCYANRAAANLNLERYYDAFKDAKSSAELDPSNEKAYYRMGKSLYSMRQFKEALDTYKKCLEKDPKNNLVKEEIEKCEKRIQESLTGIYDFKKRHEEKKRGVLRHDVADYKSDKIEVIDTPNKGKGVVARVDIKRGTLLVASKAVSAKFDSECDDNTICFNHFTNSIFQKTQAANLTDIIYKIRNDPYLAKEVYKLYPGKEIKRDIEIGEEIVDIDRLEHIQSFNSFLSKDFLDFGYDDENQNSGLWLLPSYFNHSCIPNAIGDLHGDFLSICAQKDIAKGDEITVNYVSFHNYKERTFKLERYDFKCDCKLCEVDRKDIHRERRDKIFRVRFPILDNRIRKCYGNEKILKEVLSELQDISNQIKKSYKDRLDFRYSIGDPMLMISTTYSLIGEVEKSADTLYEYFNILKDYDYHKAIFAIWKCAGYYHSIGKTLKYRECYDLFCKYFIGAEENLKLKLKEFNEGLQDFFLTTLFLKVEFY